MEGLKIIEKSYNSLQNFKNAISNISIGSQLVINLTNYDMETRTGIKNSINTILDVYKDEIDPKELDISKVLIGDTITLKILSIDGFKDDLVDSLTNYITNRSSSLFTSITTSSSSGGIYSV